MPPKPTKLLGDDGKQAMLSSRYTPEDLLAELNRCSRKWNISFTTVLSEGCCYLKCKGCCALISPSNPSANTKQHLSSCNNLNLRRSPREHAGSKGSTTLSDSDDPTTLRKAVGVLGATVPGARLCRVCSLTAHSSRHRPSLGSFSLVS